MANIIFPPNKNALFNDLTAFLKAKCLFEVIMNRFILTQSDVLVMLTKFIPKQRIDVNMSLFLRQKPTVSNVLFGSYRSIVIVGVIVRLVCIN